MEDLIEKVMAFVLMTVAVCAAILAVFGTVTLIVETIGGGG